MHRQHTIPRERFQVLAPGSKLFLWLLVLQQLQSIPVQPFSPKFPMMKGNLIHLFVTNFGNSFNQALYNWLSGYWK